MTVRNATKTAKLSIVCLGLAIACAASAPIAQARVTTGQATKASKTVVRQSDSYKQIDSPFDLKVRSCKMRASGRATCELYRSAPQACRLNGAPTPDQVCTDTVAYRSWTVRVKSKSSAKIARYADVTGEFAPGS